MQLRMCSVQSEQPESFSTVWAATDYDSWDRIAVDLYLLAGPTGEPRLWLRQAHADPRIDDRGASGSTITGLQSISTISGWPSASAPTRRITSSRAPTSFLARTPEAVEQREGRQLAHHLLSVQVGERRHAHRDVLGEFHRDAARADRDDGAEDRIDDTAHEHLGGVAHHLLHDEPLQGELVLSQMLGHRPGRIEHVAGRDVEANGLRVGLVQRTQRLECHRGTDPPGSLHRLISGGNGNRPDARQPVAVQQRG